MSTCPGCTGDPAEHPGDQMVQTFSELDGATDPGDPAVATVDPGQFAARWNMVDEEQRRRWLQAIRVASEKASLCTMLHDGRTFIP